ncbi:MAG: histidine kinase [Gammaproteobacteria bacterium]|nr:histidine kinase [Gammaproteobacteria bacterium]
MNASESSRPGMIPNLCLLPRTFMVVLLSELLAFLITLLTVESVESFWLNLGLISFFVLWNAFGVSVVLCLLRHPLNRLRATPLTFAVASIVITITALSSVIAIPLLGLEVTFDWQNPAHQWFVFRNVAVAVLISLAWMRYLYLRQQMLNSYRAEANAKFNALQAKIHPHFLFNTLNTIASLISFAPEKAESTLERLATLLRANLRPTQNLIPLQNELDICRQYLYIEQQRLGSKLQVEWELDSVEDDCLIPPFTVQPLVENAVYHGIQAIQRGGLIAVSLRIREQTLRIEVRNPLAPARTTKGNQVALENIRERLQIRYGDSAKLEIEQDDQQFTARLIIPYQPVPEEFE